MTPNARDAGRESVCVQHGCRTLTLRVLCDLHRRGRTAQIDEWLCSGRWLFLCIDCGIDTSAVTGIGEEYMVKDDVWRGVAGMRDGMLCIGCLEQRLGRTLAPDDFADAPINCKNEVHR